MTFSYFSLLKNLNTNSGFINNKSVLLKKLRRVNQKVFLKNVYSRNSIIKKQNSFKFKYLSSRFISTTLKFKVYKRDISLLKKSFLYFYKSNKVNNQDFNFINNFTKKNKFYFKYFLTSSYNINNQVMNLLKTNSLYSQNNIFVSNSPLVYKISNKFSKYKNSVFLSNFNYKYMYNHLLLKSRKIEENFISYLKSIDKSFFISKDLNNFFNVKNVELDLSKYNYIKDDKLTAYKKLNSFINFISENDLISKTKIWFFLKKYKMLLKRNFKHNSNNFIIFLKNKLKFKKNNISYFLNFSSFSNYFLLENHGVKSFKGNLIYFYFLNTQKVMLNNFFKFFQNNKNNIFYKNILNNLNLLNSVQYLDIIKYKKLKNILYSNIEFNSLNNLMDEFNKLNSNKILYNFYNKQQGISKDISFFNSQTNSFIEFLNINNKMLHISMINSIKKVILSNFFFFNIEFNNKFIFNFYFFIIFFYKKIYSKIFNKYILGLSVYEI